MNEAMLSVVRNLDRRRIGIGAFLLVMAVVIVSQGFGQPGALSAKDVAPASAGGDGGSWEASIASDEDLAAAQDARLRSDGARPDEILSELSSGTQAATSDGDTDHATAEDGSSGHTHAAGEGSSEEVYEEVTRDLPADYVAGAAPDADLAATLRASQERFNKTQLPAATNAAAALAASTRITFTRQSQIDDLRSGEMDPRIVDVLTWIVNRRGSITITSMRTDHSTCVAGSSPCRVSAHKMGRAVDIAAVDGESCIGTPGGKCGILYQEIVTSLRGTQFQPSQIIYGFDLWPSESWNFEMGNHHDHIHIGY